MWCSFYVYLMFFDFILDVKYIMLCFTDESKSPGCVWKHEGEWKMTGLQAMDVICKTGIVEKGWCINRSRGCV